MPCIWCDRTYAEAWMRQIDGKRVCVVCHDQCRHQDELRRFLRSRGLLTNLMVEE